MLVPIYRENNFELPINLQVMCYACLAYDARNAHTLNVEYSCNVAFLVLHTGNNIDAISKIKWTLDFTVLKKNLKINIIFQLFYFFFFEKRIKRSEGRFNSSQLDLKLILSF